MATVTHIYDVETGNLLGQVPQPPYGHGRVELDLTVWTALGKKVWIVDKDLPMAQDNNQPEESAQDKQIKALLEALDDYARDVYPDYLGLPQPDWAQEAMIEIVRKALATTPPPPSASADSPHS